MLTLMYAPFFGLKQEPFSIAPDPRYLFMSERHREALAHLLYGLGAGGGVVLLTGDIGAGKTTVCRCFLEQVPAHCNVAYIFNPKLTVEELMRSVCEEFGLPCPPHGASVKAHVDPLNAFLLRTHAAGQNNVLVIDEAQNLSAEVLEQLRLLTNLETNERKLLQIVLIGQPELRDMLAAPRLEQLAQRVVARFHLDALSEAETAQYVAHRLAVAGLAGPSPFDGRALRRIHRSARGVPRRINLLCDRALLGAYAGGVREVQRRIIDRAASEVFDDGARTDPRAPTRRVAAWGVAGGLLAGATIYGAAMSALRVGPAAPSATLTTAVASPAPAASSAATIAAPRAASTSASAGASAVASNRASAGASTPPAAPASSPALAGTDPAALFDALPRTEAAAWRALAPLWQLALADGDPCQAAQRQQVQCFRGRLEPALIRRLNRPGFLTLHGDDGRPAYALLLGLSSQTATLRTAAGVQTLPLLALASWWRAEFATFWRAPAGYAGPLSDGSTGPAVDWLALQLATLRREPPPAGAQNLDAALRARVLAFQLTHELRPDGIPGPTTLMQINRASGIDEPTLLATAVRP